MMSLSWLSIVDSIVKKVSSSLGVKLSNVLLSYLMAECLSFFVFLISNSYSYIFYGATPAAFS